MNDAAPVVFVIDDDASVRRALGRLLKSAGYLVETFASADAFLRRPLPDSPACLVLDVYLPGLDGLELQRTLVEGSIALPIVFITGHGDIPTTVRAMKAGAVDFLPKPFDDDVLLNAVGQALARQANILQTASEAAEIRRRSEALSPRERQVMALVVRGLLNKQAGHELGVTEKTIKVHRARVMNKMQAASLAELVRMAERLATHA
jgi:FixJ family two-component response regulator